MLKFSIRLGPSKSPNCSLWLEVAARKLKIDIMINLDKTKGSALDTNISYLECINKMFYYFYQKLSAAGSVNLCVIPHLTPFILSLIND